VTRGLKGRTVGRQVVPDYSIPLPPVYDIPEEPVTPEEAYQRRLDALALRGEARALVDRLEADSEEVWDFGES
jgi:hypothetical protein